MPDASILVINTGSSSLKLGIYVEREGREELLFDGLADGIGRQSGTLTLRDADGAVVLRSEKLASTTQQDALGEAVGWLAEFAAGTPAAIGHRVVHGGASSDDASTHHAGGAGGVTGVRSLRTAAYPGGAGAD